MKIDLEQRHMEALARHIVKELRPHLLYQLADLRDEILTVTELSSFLKVSTAWIKKQIEADDPLPHFKVKGLLRFKRSEINRWIKASR